MSAAAVAIAAVPKGKCSQQTVAKLLSSYNMRLFRAESAGPAGINSYDTSEQSTAGGGPCRGLGRKKTPRHDAAYYFFLVAGSRAIFFFCYIV